MKQLILSAFQVMCISTIIKWIHGMEIIIPSLDFSLKLVLNLCQALGAWLEITNNTQDLNFTSNFIFYRQHHYNGQYEMRFVKRRFS